ncbi:SUN domain-containing protein 3-like [Lissotriton helveticus]
MVEIVDSVMRNLQEDYVHVADFALESTGASIVASGTSSNYVPELTNAPWYLFSLENNLRMPEVILRPDVHPGNCWAFPGSQGKVVLQLSRNIHPVAVTVQHIPRAISPDGQIKSALKDFEVYGLNNERGEKATFLGQFVYNSKGDPIQVFQLWEHTGTFEFIKLRVLSNWGEHKYTCLYRFRVHQELPMQLRTTETKEHETKTSSVP